MDPLAKTETIIKLGDKIKRALGSLEVNEERCSSIRQNVRGILFMLDSADIMASGMCMSLDNLGQDMRKALNLIRDCKEMSMKLKEANQTIIDSMEMTYSAMTSRQRAPSTVILREMRPTERDEATKGERKTENRKGERNEVDREKRRGEKDEEEKREDERKKEIRKGKQHKDTENDREKRRGNEDVEEKIYGERKKEYGTGKINKETLGNVEEKRYGRGLVRITGSIAEDPCESSIKEKYYSCSSSCGISHLDAMIKDLPLYKVKLHNGAPAIAYRIGPSAATSCAENEIRVRGTAKNNIERNHRLELVGYSYHGGFLYMVYEESAGSSRGRRHDRSKGKYEVWQQCSDIICCIADGLAYLHEHDVIYMPSHPGAISIVQRGFAPPEYTSHDKFSVVYCYGIFLLEIITGEKYDEGNLTEQVRRDVKRNKMADCIHPRVKQAAASGSHVDIKRCILIALICVDENPAGRPTMRKVAGWLRNKDQVVRNPYMAY